jgi:light-regulated signal transduction histidine kinase (bacteriophytochrome)
MGNSPNYSERIFGVFKRLHRRGYRGAALGLAICLTRWELSFGLSFRFGGQS